MQLGCAIYDQSRRSLVGDDGQEISLRPKTEKLLQVLAEHPEHLFSKDDLIAAVWESVNVSDDSLFQSIAELRKVLGDDKHTVVQTIPRKGYKLVPTASVIEAKVRKLNFIAVASMLVGAIAVLAFGILTLGSKQAAVPEKPSLVVTAFDNIGEEPRWTRMGQGISADLANDLAKHPWLRVIAGKADAAADYHLAGSIQAEGGAVQVSARLVSADSGDILWSDRWRGAEGEIFEMQDRIYAKVNGAIGSDWTGAVARDAGSRAKTRGTDNLSAYENFLLGAEHKHKFNPTDYAIAVDYLTRAIEIDPEFAKAWTTLSIVYALMGSNMSDLDAMRALQEKRKAAIETAIRLAPNDPQTLIQMNWLYGHQRQPEQAEAVLRRAVELGANNADVLAEASWVGNWRTVVGPDSVAWAAKAKELNETWPDWYAMGTALSQFNLGDYPATIAAMTEAPQFIERHLYTAASQALLGNMEDAHAAKDRLLQIMPNFTLAAYVQARAIHNEAAQRPLRDGARLAGIPMGGLTPRPASAVGSLD